MENLLETYDGIAECHYKNEHYSVRDNGAVLRYPREDKRPRPTDNQWSFGNPNMRTGYMEIASVRIHRIVATAFHGEPPTKQHIVDHIDTNRQNNRPENLRWLTKFENAMLNPITAKRIAIVCGSVEEFFANPSKFRDRFPEPDLQWMCTVGSDEAQTSLKRMLKWAKSDKLPSGGSLDDWIFERDTLHNQNIDTTPEVPELIMAKTLNAVQHNWKIPCEFPSCPQEYDEDPLITYNENLNTGSVFCRNDIYSSLVHKSVLSDDHQFLHVISESTDGENAVKRWALAKITFENGVYVHTSIQNFFTKEGAEKQYALTQGHEWLGGDSIDDYV